MSVLFNTLLVLVDKTLQCKHSKQNKIFEYSFLVSLQRLSRMGRSIDPPYSGESLGERGARSVDGRLGTGWGRGQGETGDGDAMGQHEGQYEYQVSFDDGQWDSGTDGARSPRKAQASERQADERQATYNSGGDLSKWSLASCVAR